MFLSKGSNALADELNVGIEQAAMRLTSRRRRELLNQVAILRRVQDQQSMEGVATATSDRRRHRSPWRRLRTPDQRTRRAGAGQQELLPAGRRSGGGRSAAGVPGQYHLSHQERDLPAELIVNVTHEDFLVLVSAIAEPEAANWNQLPVRGTRARWQLAVTNAEQALGARLANRRMWRHDSKPLPRRSTWRSRRNAWSVRYQSLQRRGHRGFLVFGPKGR